jgi:hypothetical protein
MSSAIFLAEKLTSADLRLQLNYFTCANPNEVQFDME